MAQTLSKELTSLVDWSVTELGHIIESELGKKPFLRIEALRRLVKSSQGQSLEGLLKIKRDLSSLSRQEQFDIAHSFALMLELINSCESAYRTYRLKKELSTTEAGTHKYGQIIEVLTAHPTESRNPDIIFYFRKIQNLLERHLEEPSSEDLRELRRLLSWVWHIPMSKQRKPTVMDEAEYIYSLSLQPEILDLFIKQRKRKLPFYIRSWVGGDKDGHPGVDERTLRGSLQMSRHFLYGWSLAKVKKHIQELAPLVRSAAEKNKSLRKLLIQSKSLHKDLVTLKTLKKNDSLRLQKLKESLYIVMNAYQKIFKIDAPDLSDLKELLKVFPGLVVPLEIREDSRLVHQALTKSTKAMAISRMLRELSLISPHHDPRFYVRGFVLSQAESAADMIAGLKLTQKYLGQGRLPVVPLFESAHSLENSVEIIAEFLKSPQRKKVVQRLWAGNLEVMLGYSDSAKENGSFPSRFLIYSAIRKLEAVIQKQELTPIFFHGSGGSIERGGGSVQEQTQWWPPSALATVKVTVQGEMVYRNFSSVEIVEKQLERLATARDQAQKTRTKPTRSEQVLFKSLAEAIKKSYQSILHESDFLNVIQFATPYSFLKNLKMGSRPTKRQGAVNLQSLRAIPWVLCWTQTRVLFPTWWGFGSFWQALNLKEKGNYKKLFKNSSFFSSYIKVLGFTLAKIDLNIFSMYLHSSPLSGAVKADFVKRFAEELQLCQKALREVTGETSPLWYRPWLETSIQLRSPLIHPLNVLQLIALENNDIMLLRETVTGVASGMLTTG